MKILISPGFGAGWSTWEDTDNQDARHFILACPYLIEALEQRGKISKRLLTRFCKELKERWGIDGFYLGGAEQLVVRSVEGRFKIVEYDGSESIEQVSAASWLDTATFPDTP